MSRWKKPLTCKEVKKTSCNLGFSYRNTEGTHENWIKNTALRRWKVTVDCPKQPFTDFSREVHGITGGRIGQRLLQSARKIRRETLNQHDVESSFYQKTSINNY